MEKYQRVVHTEIIKSSVLNIEEMVKKIIVIAEKLNQGMELTDNEKMIYEHMDNFLKGPLENEMDTIRNHLYRLGDD